MASVPFSPCVRSGRNARHSETIHLDAERPALVRDPPEISWGNGDYAFRKFCAGRCWIHHHSQVARGTIIWQILGRLEEAQKGECHMKQSLMLTITSLLSILFMTFHMADDIVFKMSPPGLVNLLVVTIFVVWMYGTLALAGRRAGYTIMLLGSLLGLFVVYVHMRGSSGLMGGEIGRSSQAFFFVWTLLALGVTAMFSVVLSASALWSLPWRRQRENHLTAQGY